MKIKYAIAAALLVSMSAFAQKDELKALKKLSDKEAMPTAAELQEFKALLDKAEPLMANATTEQKADFYYYKGGYAAVSMMTNPAGGAKSLTEAIENFNKVLELEKTGKKNHTKEIQEQVYPELRAAVLTAASGFGKQSKYAEAVPLYEAAYRMNAKDTVNLYNAAAYAVNAKDYTTALKYFQELDKLGFTGSSTNYTGKNTKGEVEYYGDKKTRDLLVTQKVLTEPGVYREPSKRGDIVKNIALIYIQNGEVEKAKQAMANARKANPNDSNLIIAEADLYLKTKDMETYKKLITEATQKNPNNADLFFNLGVVSVATDKAEAMRHYEKALQINPNYVNANINMGALILDGEQQIVDQMNKLGTSAKEQKRYDELKAQRDALYKKSLPYFENALKGDPDNQYLLTVTASVYQALEMDSKYQAIKARIKK